MRRQFLLDTNHLGAAIHPRRQFLARLESAHARGLVFGTCMPVLAEVEAGIAQTSAPATNQETLRRVRRFVRLWPLDEPLARLFADLHIELKSKGRVLEMTDMFLAAFCRWRGFTLLSTDRDFEALPDIRVENWLSDTVPT